MKSDLFDAANREIETTQLFTKQNAKMLKADLDHGDFLARQGAMVAFQGDANFEHQGAGGVQKWLKKAVTGEGLPIMRVSGSGEVFLANMATDVHILSLENDRISINGMNILAFSADLEWDIQRIKGAGIFAGGLFNTTLSGTGDVALVTDGPPVVLETNDRTLVDPDAAVCWSADMKIGVETSISFQSIIGRGSGEAAQLSFSGNGFVIVQPSENMFFGAAQSGSNEQQAGSGGLKLGDIFGG